MHVCFCINIVYMAYKPNNCTKGTTMSGRKDENIHLIQLFLTKCLFVLL